MRRTGRFHEETFLAVASAVSAIATIAAGASVHRARKGNHMTIRFEKIRARLLADPRVKAEHDALAPQFEITAALIRTCLHAEETGKP
jgi:hypothetical protein